MEHGSYAYRYDEKTAIRATPERIFSYLDDHTRLSAHMSTSSLMMGGGKMETHFDEGHGHRVGSRISMSGRAFGIKIALDEEITVYEPPYRKVWETVGSPKLLIIGRYRMGIEILSGDSSSELRVFIDYDLPESNAWLGRLFAKPYARWCVRQMLYDVRDRFESGK